MEGSGKWDDSCISKFIVLFTGNQHELYFNSYVSSLGIKHGNVTVSKKKFFKTNRKMYKCMT